MDNVAVSRAVNHLVRMGLVTRGMRSSDRRRTVLDLSPDGNKVYDKITPLALRYESTLLEGLSADERRQLDTLLSKLLQQAEQLGG